MWSRILRARRMVSADGASPLAVWPARGKTSVARGNVQRFAPIARAPARAPEARWFSYA